MAIVAEYSVAELTAGGNAKTAPMAHHRAGLDWTRSGYGKRIPTRFMVRLPGSPRWRRVYCCVFSNAGTCYVSDRAGNWTVITD